MEYLRLLICGNKNDQMNKISSLLSEWRDTLGIRVLTQKEKCLADFTMEEIDEENEDYYEPFEATISISYKNKNSKMFIERITRSENRFLRIEIEYQHDDYINSLDTSIWYEMKKMILEWIQGRYNRIFWLADSQNNKIASDLYCELHRLENYLREIINSYMSIRHGGNWFEIYSYEDYINKYLKFSEWFNKSRYSLFKSVDNHLYNLEIDDIFEALKAAKRKQVSKTVKKALEDIKKCSKEKASEFAKVDLLESPSLWEEEKFDEIFDKTTVERWKSDLSKRRNMVAHNKMICRDMYIDTKESIQFFMTKFEEANKKLSGKLKSQELRDAERLLHEDEISMYLEDCGINSVLPDEQDIIENLNQTDDFIELSAIISDRISRIGNMTDDLLAMIEDINMILHEDTFFEDDSFVGKELLEQYIEFCRENSLYNTWKTLVNGEMSIEIYRLIEPGLEDGILNLIIKLNEIKQNVFFVDLECFSEGDLLRFTDFRGNKYVLTINGWFCPDRGCVDDIYVKLICNESVINYGGISISYGDYEMTEDDIPLPSTEDDISVNIGEIVEKLSNVVDDLFSDLANLESELLEIEL